MRSISLGGTSIHSSRCGLPLPAASFLRFSASRSSRSRNARAPSLSSAFIPAGSGIGPKLSSSSSRYAAERGVSRRGADGGANPGGSDGPRTVLVGKDGPATGPALRASARSGGSDGPKSSSESSSAGGGGGNEGPAAGNCGPARCGGSEGPILDMPGSDSAVWAGTTIATIAGLTGAAAAEEPEVDTSLKPPRAADSLPTTTYATWYTRLC